MWKAGGPYLCRASSAIGHFLNILIACHELERQLLERQLLERLDLERLGHKRFGHECEKAIA
jgi:hypothetical protein